MMVYFSIILPLGVSVNACVVVIVVLLIIIILVLSKGMYLGSVLLISYECMVYSRECALKQYDMDMIE